jgi:hypothetical protein
VLAWCLIEAQRLCAQQPSVGLVKWKECIRKLAILQVTILLAIVPGEQKLAVIDAKIDLNSLETVTQLCHCHIAPAFRVQNSETIDQIEITALRQHNFEFFEFTLKCNDVLNRSKQSTLFSTW